MKILSKEDDETINLTSTSSDESSDNEEPQLEQPSEEIEKE